MIDTHYFARGEARSPPGRGVSGAAVVAFPADTIGEFRGGVVGMDDVVGLTRVRLRGDDGRADIAGRHALRRVRRDGIARSGRIVRKAGHGTVGLVRIGSLAHGRRLYRVRVVGRGRLGDLYKKPGRRQWVGTRSHGAWKDAPAGTGRWSCSRGRRRRGRASGGGWRWGEEWDASA